MTVNNLAVLERDEGNLDARRALFRRALAQLRPDAGRPPPPHAARRWPTGAPSSGRCRGAPARRANTARPLKKRRPKPPMKQDPMAIPSSTSSSAGARSSPPRASGGGRRHPGRPRRDRPDRGGEERPPPARARSTPPAAGAARAASTRTCTCTSRVDRASPTGSTTTRAARRPRWRAGSPASATCRTCCPGRHRRSRARRGGAVARQAIADVFFHTVVVSPSPRSSTRSAPRCAAASRA